MIKTVVSLEIGKLYRFIGIKASDRGDGLTRWIYAPGDYRLVAVARSYRSGQDVAVYVGVGGWDDGNTWCAPMGDWARDFVLIEPEAAEITDAEFTVERVAGYRSTEGEKLLGLVP